MKSRLCQIMNWAYDNLGQVASGQRCWQNGTTVAGQPFEHVFDNIGNRKPAGLDGDHECILNCVWPSYGPEKVEAAGQPAKAAVVA